MSRVHHFISEIRNEISSAKEYAEMYVIYKNTNATWARRYKEMAEQELIHARYFHDMAIEFVNTLSWISEDDKDALEKTYAKRAEDEAIIKMMLAS